jgi:RNA-directed DNA polymerase
MQAGELRARWAWAEESVWTERMLAALEQGVKGGVWFSLIDKVYRPENLQVAFARVKANRGAAGIDGVSVAMFERDLTANLERLARELREGRYRPQGVRRVWIPKPGKQELRPLGIPTVRERVVQTALRNVLEPIFERDFAEHSYGFRPGRGCKDALRRVDALLHKGYTWVVDADLKGYFDSIPHGALMARVKAKVVDGRVLELLEAYLGQKVLDGLKEWTPEAGSPQGAVISPLLSNIYLDPLDQSMANAGSEMVRYADDFVVLCRSEKEAREALEALQEWTQAQGLRLHSDKTRIVDAAQAGGFDFLGYHFERGKHWPTRKSLAKLKDAIRPLTRRLHGHSLEALVARLNPKLRGWYVYFQHSRPAHVMKTVDGWVRQRLRHIIRRRLKRRGLSRGRENAEWPNRFFAELGLFSLQSAQATACQSSRR